MKGLRAVFSPENVLSAVLALAAGVTWGVMMGSHAASWWMAFTAFLCARGTAELVRERPARDNEESR